VAAGPCLGAADGGRLLPLRGHLKRRWADLLGVARDSAGNWPVAPAPPASKVRLVVRLTSCTPEWPAWQRKYTTIPTEVLWTERTRAGSSRTAVLQCLQ
jgi:hypothetical protein